MWARLIRRRASSLTRARSARSLMPRLTAGSPTRWAITLPPCSPISGSDVGEVVLALGVVIGESVERVGEGLPREGVGAGVHLLDLGAPPGRRRRASSPRRSSRRRRPLCGSPGRRCPGPPARWSSSSRPRRPAACGGEQPLISSALSSGVSPERTRTVSESWTTSVAARSAPPVPSATGWVTVSVPSGSTEERSWSGETITQTRSAPASRAARMGQAIIGRPQTSCRTLGTAERIRVPCPAAMIRAVTAGGFTAES